MLTRLIKICGLSTPETVDAAVSAGATHVGFVHFPKSPRHVELAQAADLRARLPDTVKAVLLLVNAEPGLTGQALETVQPDVLQLHGTETPEWAALLREKTPCEIWKALGVKDAATLAQSDRYKGAVDRLLFDAPARALPGGNGEAFDWGLLKEFKHTIAWGLAGGLTAHNVAQAIATCAPELVDTSSGVENAPGMKDVDKIAAFCEAATNA